MIDICDFGAVSGTSQPITAALQCAIDHCHAAGGGVVRFPPGNWLTGTLLLRSHVRLELTPGATLLGSTNPADYPVQPTPAYRSHHDAPGFRALIYAEKVENVGLFGGGTIDGQGAAFPFGGTDLDGRPRGLLFISCRDVVVCDLRLVNSALWLQHYLDCERVQIRGLRIWNHANHNNDMMDLDGCRGVTVSDCIGDTDDDGITLKSTGPAPCENITVSNCVVSSRCNAIKLGTESIGGFRNISISNCVVHPTAFPGRGVYGHATGTCGLALEIVDGGTLEHVTVRGLTIRGTRSPIFIRLADRGRPHIRGGARPNVGRLRHVRITDVTVIDAGTCGSSISGVPGAEIDDVILQRVRVHSAAPAEPTYGDVAPPELRADYPEATMFGDLPAHGLFIRHARGVRLEDVEFVPAPGDKRPALAVQGGTATVKASIPAAVIPPPAQMDAQGQTG